MKSRQTTAIIVAIGLMAMACTSSPPSQSSQVVPKTGVDTQLFSFKPAGQNLSVGTTVIWKSLDAGDHSVAAGKNSTVSGAVETNVFTQAQSLQNPFASAGDFLYYCMRQPSLEGGDTVN